MRGISQGARGASWWREPAFVERFWVLHQENQGKGHSRRIAAELGVSLSYYYLLKQWVPRPGGEQPGPVRLVADEKRERWREAQRKCLGLDPFPARSTGRPFRARGVWKGGKRVLTPAGQEANSQRQRCQNELLERGGKSFWDERGRAQAKIDDMTAVSRLFAASPKE